MLRAPIVVSALTAAMLLATRAEPQSDIADMRGDVERGSELYQRFSCYACHGHTGETGDGARLNPPRLPQAAFVVYVRNPPRLNSGPFAMPAYAGDEVTDQMLVDIYAYVESLPSGTPPLEDIELLNDL